MKPLSLKLFYRILIFSLCIFSVNVFSQTTTDSISPDLADSISYNRKLNISIRPPKYFQTFEQINGFVHPWSASTIEINEIKNTVYSIMVDGITSEYIKEQGFELIKKENVKTKNGKDGVMFLVSFTVKGVKFNRIMFFTGDLSRTIWINANFPELANRLLFDVLKNSLLSIEF